MAAEQGDALSQYHLGFAYQQGRGRLLKDYKQAAYWYKKSAESGDPDAQVKIGLAYYLGKGVPRNEIKAVSWYKKSAAQNNYNAQYFLGLAHCEGRGISKSLGDCASLIRKAHENGDPSANKVWERYKLWDYQ
jgi:TPR repeat protein